MYGVCYVTVNLSIRWSHSKSKQHNCSILEHWHFRKYIFPTITMLHPVFHSHKASRDGCMLAVEASSRGDIRKGTCPGQGVLQQSSDGLTQKQTNKNPQNSGNIPGFLFVFVPGHMCQHRTQSQGSACVVQSLALPSEAEWQHKFPSCSKPHFYHP